MQIGKLYTLGMLRSLNMRAKLRQKFRSVDLGGRISLSGGNDDTYSAQTSTANNSDPCPDVRESILPLLEAHEFSRLNQQPRKI